MRHQKDPDELEKLSRCYGLAWVAVDAVRAAAETGATEIEMFTQALAAAQLTHGEPVEFSADLLCGPNTADDGPKRIAGSRRVSAGESVTADIRVGVGGYWSDICETHIVASNDEITQTRNALIEIQTAAAAQLSPRSTGAAIYKYVQTRINETFANGEFPHHAGHGVGTMPIEDPRLMPLANDRFEEGMVVSIEPGVYFPNRWGARIERTFLVTSNGGVELPGGGLAGIKIAS